LPVSKPPIFTFVKSEQPAASANTVQFEYQFAKGTTLVNGTLQIFGLAASTGLTELGTGALASGVTGDVIKGYADFQIG
jgi:hypothetical protein